MYNGQLVNLTVVYLYNKILYHYLKLHIKKYNDVKEMSNIGKVKNAIPGPYQVKTNPYSNKK